MERAREYRRIKSDLVDAYRAGMDSNKTKTWPMKYKELKEYFNKYHMGFISKSELIAAIGLYQEYII